MKKEPWRGLAYYEDRHYLRQDIKLTLWIGVVVALALWLVKG